MSASSKRKRRFLPVASAVLGLLLVGIAGTPAHAESVRAMQWHLDAMHADEMWKASTGKGVTVAVIDSGVDNSLADLKGQVLDGKDYSEQQGDEHTDIEGHGTSIAALIAATGARGQEQGSYGLAPDAKILPIRMRYAMENFGKVDGKAEYSRVLTRAIRYAADTEAQIINISMGSSNAPGRKNVGTPELAAAVQYAISRGKLIFAAVGNRGDSSNIPEYPASTPGVVGVGAITEEIERLPISQRGAEVDVTAPGHDMVSACLSETRVCRSEGTSDATAIASASAALIWAKHPEWTNNQVLRVLVNTMKGNEKSWTRNDEFGYGIVRPRIALTDPGDPGPADEYPLPDLAAAASAAPSAEASASAGADEPKPAVADLADDEGGKPPWVALGAAAAAVLAGAVALLVALRARRRRATPVPAAPPYPPSYGPPPGTGPGQGRQD